MGALETLFVAAPFATFGQYSLVWLTIVFLSVGYCASAVVYNIAFHPLAKYPGPWLAAGTQFWMIRSYLKGTLPEDLLKLHNRYGPVVRTSPNELSYISPPQWKEIYGHKQGQPEFSKDSNYHSGMKGGPVILNADRHDHGYIRKLMAHGFSEKALREQEPVVRRYVDLLFRQVQALSEDGAAIDISAWYNYLTFDFIGFLTFGETFDCLDKAKSHEWIDIFFSGSRNLAISQAISRMPSFAQMPAKLLAIPKSVRSDVATMNRLNTEKINHRIKHGSEVPDFMDKLIEAYKENKMSHEQLVGNGMVLIGAGSETTATALSGLTFLLLANTEARDKLATEVRGAFASPEDITIAGANQCKYLLACIEETLRIYPPSPQPHHRIVPDGGAMVDGKPLPGGTAVSIPIYAATRSPENFTEPDRFLPERWLGEERFASDKRDAFQPFSYGPRNCIGRNLAYVEMKLVIARLLWQFDIENATEGNWLDQKVFMTWDQEPLWIKLHPRERA